MSSTLLLTTEKYSRLKAFETASAPTEDGQWSRDGRLSMEAVTVAGRGVGLEFRLLGDLVSLGRRGSGAAAVFERSVIKHWIADAVAGFPVHELIVDEARLGTGHGGRVNKPWGASNNITTFPMVQAATSFSYGAKPNTEFRGRDTLSRSSTTKLRAGSDG